MLHIVISTVVLCVSTGEQARQQLSRFPSSISPITLRFDSGPPGVTSDGNGLGSRVRSHDRLCVLPPGSPLPELYDFLAQSTRPLTLPSEPVLKLL